MVKIKENQLQELIKRATMICVPQFGYYIETEFQENPYLHQNFVLEPGCDIFLYESDNASLVTIKKEEKIILTAFVIN